MLLMMKWPVAMAGLGVLLTFGIMDDARAASQVETVLAGETALGVPEQNSTWLTPLSNDTYRVRGEVRCPSGVARNRGPRRDKVGISNSTTPRIDCPTPRQGSATAQADGEGSTTLGFGSFKYTVSALARSGSENVIQAEASLRDPFSLRVGAPGDDLPIEQSLLAGTQVQRPLEDAPTPYAELTLRFALGDFDSADPDVMWPEGSVPPDSFDPVHIRIFEDPGGTLQADVQLSSDGPGGIAALFSQSADEIEALIENASWSLGPTHWTLASDLVLFQMFLSNTDESLTPVGSPAGFGIQMTTIAQAVPEPASLGFLALGGLTVAGLRRRKAQAAGTRPFRVKSGA